MKSLRIGYSPCPNDTFIFHGLASGAVDWPGGLDVTLADVEHLNGLAEAGELDVVKVSVAAAAGILDDYVLLRAGGGHGLRRGAASGGAGGPLVGQPGRCAGGHPRPPDNGQPAVRPVLPRGGHCRLRQEMVFDGIMDAVLSGKADAGVIIHEGRFTFRERGLVRLVDLGAWWEERTGLPIPLGGIAIRRSLGMDTALAMNAAIRESLTLARENPERALAYVRQHAQEMDDAVIRQHIETFVTGYSMDVGEVGERGVERLLAEAGWIGVSAFISL